MPAFNFQVDWIRATFRRVSGLCLVVAVQAFAALAWCESPPVEGTSSREARERATRNIPLSSLTPEAVNKLRPVLDDPTIFRRMPVQTVPSDHEFFNFIVRYPEVLVEIWKEMGVTKVETDRTGPYSFEGDDGAGTTCKNELILGSDRLHIYYSDGFYTGPMVARKLEGRCVCVVYGQGSVGEGTQQMVSGHMDIFLKLDNLGADLIAKTLSPLVVKTADYNYIETLRFISQLSTAAQRDPEAVDRLSQRLKGLHPEVRTKFVQVANQAALRRDRLISAHWREALENEKAEQPVSIATPNVRPDNDQKR